MDFYFSLSPEQIWNLYQNKTWQIASNETIGCQNWSVDAYPNDKLDDGAAVRSNSILILGNLSPFINSVPSISTLTLNTTAPLTNNTNANLTVYNVTSDTDNDNGRVIYNWLENDRASPGPGRSITVVNMPFEGVNNSDGTYSAWDYSGYHNNGTAISGTVSGATFNTTGGIDGRGAYRFYGVDDYINIPASASINALSKNGSISFWTKNEVTPAQFDALVSRSPAWSGWGFFYNSGTTVQFFVGNYNSDVATATITPTQWNHIVGTFDGKNIRIFVNGVEGTADSTTTTNLFSGLVSTTPIEIGRMVNSNTYNINGHIDELMIFNISLSTEQIWNLYQNKTWQIASNETIGGQNWSVDAYPNDKLDDGAAVRSNSILILGNLSPFINSVPSISTLTLNTTAPLTNNTNTNLTVYNVTSDTDNDNVRVIYNWLVNDSASPGPGRSITVVNMPFEGVNNSDGTYSAWDYSGYHNNGTAISGATFNTTGGIDGRGAYRFDGVDDYINIPASASINALSKNGSISFWTKNEVTPTQWDGLVSRFPAFGNGWGFFYNSGTTVQFFVGAYNSDVATATITPTQWNHIVGTFDGKNIRIFVNGVEGTADSTTTTNLFSGLVSTTPIEIGRMVNSNTYNINGHIDELMIFNISLSTEQIWNLYQNKTWQIASNETIGGQHWSVDAYPNDKLDDGAAVRSNSILILGNLSPFINSVPSISTLTLNTTAPLTNNTNTNLTVYNVTSDTDNDNVRVIYNWLVNDSASPGPGRSITVVNMPFEGVNNSDGTYSAWDYSGYHNNGTAISGATFNTTGGIDGRGAYRFDGVDDYINIPASASINALSKNGSISFWTKNEVTPTQWDGLVSRFPAFGNGWGFFYNSGTTVQFFVGAYNSDVATATITPTQWNHIV